VLLTFLWRAKEETRNVVVAGGMAGYDFSDNQMSRLLDTDLWHRTYKVRNDARFGYNLSLNDSLVPFDKIDMSDQKIVMQRVSTFKRIRSIRRPLSGFRRARLSSSPRPLPNPG
jgi:hypothetical protein